jgi:uncharacterized membrane protein
MAFAVVGLLITSYLTWLHWGGSDLLCRGIGDCEKVNFSAYSEVVGIPISLFGFGMYLAMGTLAGGYLWSPGIRPAVWLLLLMLTTSGTLYSAYLTYVEIFILQAICPWCVASAILIALSLGIVLLSARENVRR